MNDEMNDFFNGDMDDDEFRRRFMEILNKRQRDMERFLREMYGVNNPFGGMFGPGMFGGDMRGMSGRSRTNTSSEDELYRFLSNHFGNGENTDDMNIESGTDEFGNSWESRSWTSPDGSMTFYSSSRLSDFNPDDIRNLDDYYGNSRKKTDPLEVLESKLSDAIEDENYEAAAKFRDAIKAIKEKKDTSE